MGSAVGLLIDTSTLIDAERGRIAFERHLEHYGDERVFLSVITVSELLHGVHRATQPEVQAKRSAFVEALLQRFPIVPIDVAIARAHAQLWAALEAQGTRIGAHDLWLAATGIARDMTLVTANVREFSRVPGLRIAVWQT